MNSFSLVMAYYENANMLREHLAFWRRGLPYRLAAGLHVVIVDDGSPSYPAVKILRGHDLNFLGSFQLWRMGVDVRWNQDACRNIGVREAPTRWVLLTDMDHVVPWITWERLMNHQLEKRSAYRFGRVTKPDMGRYKHHPNSWAMTKKLYWKAGGYDEALAGNYGTDGDFMVRLKRVADLIDLPQVLIRYPREVIADASTTTLTRKSDDDKLRVSRLIAARRDDPKWAPRHFSFPCERVL